MALMIRMVAIMMMIYGRNMKVPTRIFSIISLFISLLLLIGISMPGYAAVGYIPGTTDIVPVDFGNWNTPMIPDSGGGASSLVQLTYDGNDSDVYWEGIWSGAWRGFNFVRHFFDDDVCLLAPVSNGHHSFVARHTMVNGNTGNYYICEYCGLSAGEVLENAYDSYVSDLPANGINSLNELLWYVTVDDILWDDVNYPSRFGMGNSSYVSGSPVTSPSFSSPGFLQSVDCHDGHGLLISGHHNNNGGGFFFSYGSFSLVAPFNGVYVCLSGFSINGSAIGFDGNVKSLSFTVDVQNSSHVIGDHFNIDYLINPIFSYKQSAIFDYTIDFPVFKIVSSNYQSILNTTYNSNTRLTSIQGDLAYYNNSGTLTLSPSTHIVSEIDKSVYNPVTNTTTDISGWSYDYSTRTYDLSTTSGDTISVTYGDENITINEGGETYYVYYVTENQAPPPHVHNYVGSVTMAPTCTDTGIKTYVCPDDNDTYTEVLPALGHTFESVITSEPGCTTTGIRSKTCTVCGDVVTEILPALGHDWQIKSQVQTEYDNDGQLIQQGYTIYKCSRCGEEYRSDDSVNPSPPTTPPPSDPPAGGDGGGGSSGGGDGGLSGYTSEKLSGFQRFWEIIVSYFTELPSMFEDVTSFMADAFPYIPEEIMYLIGFGVAMAVLVGIFKLVFR